MLIRYANEKDKTQLKAIWQSCFSDSEKFVKWNFENNFAPENAMVVEVDGKIVSNLHLIPYDVVLKGKALKGIYVSAVATLKEERGKGYASHLLNAALDEISKKGADIAFLVPAIKGYYDRFGFFEIAPKVEYIMEREIPSFVEDEVLCPAAEDAHLIYLSAMKDKELYLKRSLKDMELIISDLTENTGGEILMPFFGEAYAMFKEFEDKIKVFELLGENEDAEEKTLFELSKYGKPLEFEFPCVMVKLLNKNLRAEDFILPRENIYFNLIL